MRRGGGGGVGGGGFGGGRRLPKSSMASSSAAEGTPSANPLFRNLESAFSRRDSDAASLCSSRPPSSIGKGPAAGVPNYSDRATQAAALRVVNAFLDPDVTLRPPLPAARDILTALRILLQRIHVPLQEKEPGFEDELIQGMPLTGDLLVQNKGQQINSKEALVRCEYRMAEFSTGDQRRKPKGDRRSTEILLVIRQTMEASILTNLMPHSQIDIFVQVLQADGG